MIDKNGKTFAIGDTVTFEQNDGRYAMGKVVDAPSNGAYSNA